MSIAKRNVRLLERPTSGLEISMIRGICITTVLMVAPWPVSAADPPRLPRDNLLIYRGTDGKPREVKTVEDWAKRRAEIVRGMEAVMGKLPGKEKRCPLDVKVEEERDCGKYIRRLITYASEPGSRVPAYLLVPKALLKGERKAPAILCLHGTDNVVGHGTVGGSARTPTAITPANWPSAAMCASRRIIHFWPSTSPT